MSPLIQAQSRAVSPEIHAVIFQSREFLKPLEVTVYADDRAAFDTARRLAQQRPFLMPIMSNFGFNNSRPTLRAFLIGNGFATVEMVTIRDQRGYSEDHQFLLYTEKMDKLLANAPKGFWQMIKLAVGKRRLKSIDFTNAYKGSPGGIELQFFFAYFYVHAYKEYYRAA